VLTPPRALSYALREAARWEWRTGDGGDPVALAGAFLDAYGLTPGAGGPPAGIAGATLLLGAAALPADLATLPPPAASPCPAVPDAVVVVYEPGPPPADEAPDPGPLGLGPWTPSWSRADHAQAVERVREAIARGDLYQANVVGHRSAPAGTATPDAVAARLARVPHTPYAGHLAGDGWSVHSASPESFLETARNEQGETVVRVRPIKGTAADPATLKESLKDRAEHIMIVDLERNDLGRVAVPGTVTVPHLYDVVPRAGVWHAESTVQATLQQGYTFTQLLSATFPGGSVTGAPKRAALALLHDLEPVGRGPSMGAFGWVRPDGTLDLGLSIRTFALAEGRLHLWTGGGVTWGSTPAAEVAEADAKAAPLLTALKD
jgi:para-aminobenzoate synthetase component 1